jgi:hypothetical protein
VSLTCHREDINIQFIAEKTEKRREKREKDQNRKVGKREQGDEMGKYPPPPPA